MNRIVISDNTSDVSLRRRLDIAVGGLPADVCVIRPTQDLQMAVHWEWALQRARALHPQARYIMYLTDRRRIIPGKFDVVRSVAQRWPNEIVSFLDDAIDDVESGVVYQPSAASGCVFALSARRLLELASRSIFPDALPLMHNCVVPMPVIDRLHGRFGDLFGDAAPDYRFAFRALAVERQIIFFDGAIYGHDHLDRSNGASLGRGDLNGDAADFSTLTTAFNAWAPVPELLTLTNAVLNEYCAVCAETNGELSKVDKQAYARANAVDVARFKDSGLRNQQEQVLRKLDSVGLSTAAQVRLLPSARGLVRSAAVRLAATQLGTWTCQRAHARGLWVPPSGWMRFPSGTAALRYASKHPVRPARNGWHLAKWGDEGIIQLASAAEVSVLTRSLGSVDV